MWRGSSRADAYAYGAIADFEMWVAVFSQDLVGELAADAGHELFTGANQLVILIDVLNRRFGIYRPCVVVLIIPMIRTQKIVRAI